MLRKALEDVPKRTAKGPPRGSDARPKKSLRSDFGHPTPPGRSTSELPGRPAYLAEFLSYKAFVKQNAPKCLRNSNSRTDAGHPNDSEAPAKLGEHAANIGLLSLPQQNVSTQAHAELVMAFVWSLKRRLRSISSSFLENYED